MKSPYEPYPPARIKLPTVDPLSVPDPVQIMAAPPALPGLHYVSGFDSASIARHWAHLRKVQPRWMVVVGAAQFNEARDFARSVQTDAIRTNVIFRHWKSVLGSFSDNGRMHDLTAAEWIERVGSQHVNAPYWVMADNESGGLTVVKNTADLIPRASSVKLKLAVGAWSSHNPHRVDWPLYMPIFEQLYAHPEHVYAPHIYYSRPPKSVENLDGFKHVADHLAHVEKVMGAPIPFEVVITEYGRLANPNGTWLDPDKGYALEGVSEAAYADELVWLASPYKKWHFVVFSSGAWGTRGSLGVGKDYEARMEQYASGEIPMPIAPVEPEEAPPPEGTLKRGKLKRASNVRKGVGTAASNPAIALLPVDQAVEYYEKDPLPFSGGYYWLQINTTLPDGTRLDGHFIALTGAEPSIANQIEPTPDSVPVEPEPPVDPDDTQEPPVIQYVTLDEAREMVDAAKEATMRFMKEWTLSLLTELVKADADAQVKKIELLSEKPQEAA